MKTKILFVDDEIKMLQACKRRLHRKFDMDTATGGVEALALIGSESPYAVIVSDMQMPGMDGVELLSQVKQCAPDMVRIMLTGNSDQQTSIDAVNEGEIFRFLNKPCSSEALEKVLLAGLEQHRLITTEKDLLENTLRASVQALVEVLALSSPEAFGRTTRIKRYMHDLGRAMELPELWRLETLALLSQIGCVTLPSGLLLKVSSAKVLTDDEAEQFKQHPEVGSQLLANIPRMEEVAECVKYQEKHFDGTGAPQGKHTGTEIPLGARLLKAVLDFDQWRAAGLTPEQALAMMTQHADRYDPQVLGGLVQAFSQPTDRVIMEVSVTQLTDEMFLASDVQIRDGVLLVCEGQQTTNSVRQHLQRFWKAKSIDEMVRVTMAPTAEVAA